MHNDVLDRLAERLAEKMENQRVSNEEFVRRLRAARTGVDVHDSPGHKTQSVGGEAGRETETIERIQALLAETEEAEPELSEKSIEQLKALVAEAKVNDDRALLEQLLGELQNRNGKSYE